MAHLPHDNLRLADLVDLKAIQAMADTYYRAARMPTGIIDAIDDSILVGAGWQEICLNFHRAHPVCLKCCQESDRYIKTTLADGEAHRYKCKNGLWDIAIPIIVAERHLGTMFLGQFFFDDEIPDRDFFARQAEMYGFNVEEYLAALDKVPVLSHEKVETILEYDYAWVTFIATLAENALSKIKYDEKIRLKKERFALAQGAANIGIWDWDIESGSLYWSEQIEPMFGFAKGEFGATFHSFLECVHPDDRRYVTESLRACLDRLDHPCKIEHRIIWPDGTLRWVSETGKAFRDEGARPLRMVGVVIDITERKLDEENLRLSEQKYSSIFNLMPDMVGITRLADGKFLDVNPGFEKWTGWKKEEALGRSSLELGLWDPNARGRAMEILKDKGSVENFEYVCHTKSGELRNAEMYLTTIKVSGEDCIYFMARDTTERKRAEEAIRSLNEELERRVRERTRQLEQTNAALENEVQQRQRSQTEIEQLNRDLLQHSEALKLANRELESFCYSVSHDLRSPLRHMSGFGRMLMEDYGDQLDVNGTGYIERIISASSRMGNLIDSLLQLSRISRTVLKLETVDLSRTAADIVTELQETTPEREVRVEIADGLTAMGDSTLIDALLRNLLGNAWKYTRETIPAWISFYAKESKGQPVFCIEDNGVGFDMQYAFQLFDPFQRLHGSEYEGTGIGLATVQRIIHRHCGRIWAEAEENRGARFFFTLAPEAEAGTPPSTLHKGGTTCGCG